jgi:RNA polymerase sigma factor (sigma-70 family)
LVLLSSDIRKLTEAELVLKYKSTRESIYVGELYKRYMHLVMGVCMKYLKDEDKAKDLLSQIFEHLLSDLLKHEVSNFKGWLFSVAKNASLMYLRGHKTLIQRQKELKKDLQPDMESAHELHHNPVLEKELQLSKLERAVRELSPEQRNCVDLFYLQEKSYKQISTLTGYSLNEVKSFIQNGKRNLKTYMESPK